MWDSRNCICGRRLTSKEISEGMSYIEWKSQGILNVSEPRDRKKICWGGYWFMSEVLSNSEGCAGT